MAAARSADSSSIRGVAGFAKISTYWFSLNALWAGLNSIIVPSLIVQFVPENSKGTALSLIVGTGLLVSIIVQPAAGAVSDSTVSKWGRRRPFIFIGSVLDVIGLALIALSGSYLLLFVGCIALQITSNIAQGPFEGLIPDLVASDQRGRASGFAGVAIVAGSSFGVLISGLLINMGYHELAVVALAAIIIAGMLVTVFFVPDTKFPAIIKRGKFEALRRAFSPDVFRYRDFVFLIISRFFILAGIYTVRDFGFYFVRDVLRLEDAEFATAQLMTIVAMSTVATVLIAGIFSDRVGRKKLVLFTCVVGILASIAFFNSTTFGQVAIFGIAVGIGMGSFLSVDWAFATDLIPRSQAGRFMGLSNVATSGASALGLLIGGPLLDFFNSQTTNLGYRALMWVVIAYFVIGTIFLIKVREHRLIDAEETAESSASG